MKQKTISWRDEDQAALQKLQKKLGLSGDSETLRAAVRLATDRVNQ